MKTQFIAKSTGDSIATVERKNIRFRSGVKSSAHRYERRRIREQLRHLDWALAGVD